MRLPDFLIIGAAKSSTSSLRRYISKHPQIYFAPVNESQFFAVDEKYQQGLDWYSGLFRDAREDQICGEVSTDYTKYPQFPETAERIYQAIPNVKMIYIMRNPIDRAYSYYVHLQRNKPIQYSFEEFNSKTSVCLDGSHYMMQIKNYLRFFNKDKFLFLLMDDFQNNPRVTAEKIINFLGVDSSLMDFSSIPPSNVAKNVLERNLNNKISGPIRKTKWLKPFYQALPKSFRDSAYTMVRNSPYGRMLAQKYTPRPMLPSTRQSLREHFAAPNQELSIFLGRDLSHWV